MENKDGFAVLFSVSFFILEVKFMNYDVAIVGAGIIGGMLARELSKYKLSCVILEKENDVAIGASKANSGIIHGGYDPEPNTLKARLNREGVDLIYEAAKQLNVPFKNNGSLVCSFSTDEDKTIIDLFERGKENSIKGLQVISGDEARKLEPNLSEKITSALLVPSGGIICPYKLTVAAIGNAMDNGVELKRNFTVSKIEKVQDEFIVESSEGENVECKFLINCAGCYSDKIAKLAGEDDFEIIPRAGEYLLLDKTAGGTVSRTIFQVPSSEGKGILVSPTADGNLLLGPTAQAVETPDNKEITAKGIENIILLSKKSVPSLNLSKVITSFTGIRSSEKNGDFIIEPSKVNKNFVNVAAIDSPGLTSCVAIARYVVDILSDLGISLDKKENWNGNREDTEKFNKMSDDEKNEFIKLNPAYGKIVCRCETITEGEIRDAISRNPKALDMDGVKRRTRAGMGRCQGGFCTPYVMKLISEENGIPMEKVTKKGGKSYIIAERI